VKRVCRPRGGSTHKAFSDFDTQDVILFLAYRGIELHARDKAAFKKCKLTGQNLLDIDPAGPDDYPSPLCYLPLFVAIRIMEIVEAERG